MLVCTTLGLTNIREGYKQPYNNYISIYAKSPTTGSWTEYYSYENSGEINVTRKDEDNVVFSGTFYARLRSNDGEIVEVTQGRFDIDKKEMNN